MADFVVKFYLLVIFATCAVLGQNYQFGGNIYNGCDYFETIELGRVYDVFSPYYPEKYTPGTNCRWSGCAPYGTNILIRCTDMAIPVYGQCDQNSDRLEISYQGCQDLVDASRHCTRPFVMETRSNALVMALRTFSNTTGGRFFCQVSAHQTALPPPRPVSPGGWITGPSFPQRPSFVNPSISGPPAIYRPPTPTQFNPTFQQGFQPSYPAPSYPSPSFPQQTYYPSRPVAPPPPQPSQPIAPPQPQVVQPSRPDQSVQPIYQPSFQPGFPASYPAFPPSYRPIYQQPGQPASPSVQPPQPVYNNGGFWSGFYPSQPGFPGYVPTQPVYQPMGPQDQSQCQVQCGLRKRARILNGVSVDIEQMPFACGLIDLTTKRVFCDATIISNQFIVTVAHCLYNRTIDTIGIIVGTTDYARPSESRYAATYRIFGVVIHPDYEPVSMLNDVAIIKTGPIEFNPAVAPVCLPISERLGKQSYAYSPVEVAGWGETSYTGPPSTRLQAVTLNVITNEQCNDNYPYRITASQMCLLTPRKDTCTGDDGAGLCHIDTVTGRLVLVGMPSYGVGCGTRQPRVASRISSYIPWILRTTNENFCVI